MVRPIRLKLDVIVLIIGLGRVQTCVVRSVFLNPTVDPSLLYVHLVELSNSDESDLSETFVIKE